MSSGPEVKIGRKGKERKGRKERKGIGRKETRT
jgi:hypothetical protein